MNFELPPNMMSVVTTITNKVGSVERTLSTSLVVQTHRMDELATAVRLAWAETIKQEHLEKEKQ